MLPDHGADLAASQAMHFDLYDLAPVGSCTVNASGLILQANLTAPRARCKLAALAGQTTAAADQLNLLLGKNRID